MLIIIEGVKTIMATRQLRILVYSECHVEADVSEPTIIVSLCKLYEV
jgi:hypothetical protein